MEKKTKYRIVGILAIAALAIVVIPLFQKNNEFKAETLAIKAPPFPGQTQLEGANQASVPIQEQPAEVGNNSIQLDTEGVITTIHPSIVSDVQEPVKNTPQHLNNVEQPVKETDIQQIKKVEKETKELSMRLAAIKQDKSEKQKSANGDNGLMGLKTAAWVIQIGSFRYEANALRMVNELRANGYRAFIQKTATHLGENTRVFVGPENKQNDAYALATRLENDLHIHGIVVSYKPLAL